MSAIPPPRGWSLLRRLSDIARSSLRDSLRGGSYRPRYPRRINRRRLLRDVADFFTLPLHRVNRLFAEYDLLHRSRGYETRFGELKTLNREEAFVIYVHLATRRPEGAIVEIGTQYGRSTRRLLDMRDHLGLGGEIVAFDVEDQVRHFSPDEARLVLEDVTDSVARDVLEAHHPELVLLDARPFRLIRNVVEAILRAVPSPVLAIHDCGRGLCNPRMALDRDDANVSSRTGIWERHVLAEVFGVADPLSPRLDDLETDTHRLRIFGTAHGLGVIAPRSLGAGRTHGAGDPSKE